MFLEKLLILLQVKNINKVILFFILFLYSCSNFEFVYKNIKMAIDKLSDII